MDKDIACLFRLKTKFNTQIDALPLGEHFITIGETSVIQLRILKFNIGNGTLATTLLDLTISSSLFKELYFMRWGVETFIDVIKNKLELHNFSGRTIEALEQDVYITHIQSLLLYVWVDDGDTKIEQKKEALYQKKMNLNHAVGVLSDNILGLLKGKKIASIILAMTEATIRIIIPVMPNRQTKRMSYSRATKYHQNCKSTV
ncbi:MAG: hypothetical protein ACRC6X_03755 [Culicoidibacterales bacterium]